MEYRLEILGLDSGVGTFPDPHFHIQDSTGRVRSSSGADLDERYTFTADRTGPYLIQVVSENEEDVGTYRISLHTTAFSGFVNGTPRRPLTEWARWGIGEMTEILGYLTQGALYKDFEINPTSEGAYRLDITTDYRPQEGDINDVRAIVYRCRVGVIVCEIVDDSHDDGEFAPNRLNGDTIQLHFDTTTPEGYGVNPYSYYGAVMSEGSERGIRTYKGGYRVKLVETDDYRFLFDEGVGPYDLPNISPGDTLNANIDYPRDKDSFVFTVESGVTYTFRVNRVTDGGLPSGEPVINTLSYEGTGELTDTGNTSQVFVGTTTGAGTVVLDVQAFGTQTGTYTVSLTTS